MDAIDRLAGEARVMFAHLPEGEIEPDEPLFFAAPRGRLIVFVPRTEGYYMGDATSTRRYRKLPPDSGLVEVTEYVVGEAPDIRVVPLEAIGGPGVAPWMN